jgi:hypothetical protein
LITQTDLSRKALMNSLPRIAAVTLVLACYDLALPTRADDHPTHLAKSIQVESSQPGSLEAALGVRSVSGALELTKEVHRGTLVLDLYHDGKKVHTESGAIDVGKNNSATRWGFIVQVIDLDVLPLKDGKPGQFRVVSTLRSGGSVMSRKADVAKDVFPLGNAFGQSTFNTNLSSSAEVPLFTMILNVRPDGKGHTTMNGGGTIEETLRSNANSDLLIARFLVPNDAR